METTEESNEDDEEKTLWANALLFSSLFSFICPESHPSSFPYKKVPIYANSPHIDIYKRDKWGLRPKASLFLYTSLFFAKSPGVETIRSKYIFEFSKLELYQKMIKKSTTRNSLASI